MTTSFEVVTPGQTGVQDYRGRDDTLDCIAPPSEPDWRISRIRLSSRWFYLIEDWSNFIWASTRLKSPCSRKNLFGQRK